MKAIIDISPAQKYLTDLKFNEWNLFTDIPDDIFNDVFELIDTNYRWYYCFDEFDIAFKKHFKF